MKKIILWFGYVIALILSFTLLYFDFKANINNSIFLFKFAVTIFLLVFPLILQYQGLKEILQKFISNIGDIESYRRELFKFKTEMTTYVNSQQEIIQTLQSDIIPFLENTSKKTLDLIDINYQHERLQNLLIGHYEDLFRRSKMYDENKNKIELNELNKILDFYEKFLSQIGITVYNPKKESFFNEEFEVASEINENSSQIIQNVEMPGFILNGKVIKKAKIILKIKEEKKDIPTETTDENSISTDNKNQKLKKSKIKKNFFNCFKRREK